MTPSDTAPVAAPEVRAHQDATLEQIRRRPADRTYQVRGARISVAADVFPPGGTDTALALDCLPVDLYGRRVLDATTGSGVIAAVCGVRGASGVALDINPAAVACANANFATNGIDFTARVSNGLESLEAGEAFDLIVAVPPYLEGALDAPLAHAFYGARALMDDLFGRAASHLRPGGTLLVTAALWGEIDYYEQSADSFGWQRTVLATATSQDGERTYRADCWSH